MKDLYLFVYHWRPMEASSSSCAGALENSTRNSLNILVASLLCIFLRGELFFFWGSLSVCIEEKNWTNEKKKKKKRRKGGFGVYNLPPCWVCSRV